MIRLPDSRYTIAREFCGYPAPMYVARFCDRFVSCHTTELEAATALWDYHGDRMHDMLNAAPCPLGTTA